MRTSVDGTALPESQYRPFRLDEVRLRLDASECLVPRWLACRGSIRRYLLRFATPTLFGSMLGALNSLGNEGCE